MGEPLWPAHTGLPFHEPPDDGPSFRWVTGSGMVVPDHRRPQTPLGRHQLEELGVRLFRRCAWRDLGTWRRAPRGATGARTLVPAVDAGGGFGPRGKAARTHCVSLKTQWRSLDRPPLGENQAGGHPCVIYGEHPLFVAVATPTERPVRSRRLTLATLLDEEATPLHWNSR